MQFKMIKTGRQYYDPRVSSMTTIEQKIRKAFKSGIKSKIISQKRK